MDSASGWFPWAAIEQTEQRWAAMAGHWARTGQRRSSGILTEVRENLEPALAGAGSVPSGFAGQQYYDASEGGSGF